jgi:hypothetical protein
VRMDQFTCTGSDDKMESPATVMCGPILIGQALITAWSCISYLSCAYYTRSRLNHDSFLAAVASWSCSATWAASGTH